jgi:GYF domain 2
MVSQWYYGRGSDISGPASGQDLMDLVDSGKLLRTDTVWPEGVEDGVQAGSMESLFAPVVVSSFVPGEMPNEIGLVALGAQVEYARESVLTEQVETPPEVKKPAPVSRARAVAGKGAVIVGQDGKNVKFQMKCSTCGHQDTSWKTIAIPRGIARASFYCQKCRKKRDAEIHGMH